MKKIISFIFLVCFSFKCFAGSADAILKGTSSSGRTTFICQLHDVTGGLFYASLSIDGEKLLFDENDHAAVIYDLENKTFTIYLHNTDYTKELYFWMIPNTFKKIKGDNYYGKYLFDAKVYTTDPRKNKDHYSPQTILKCEYQYEI